MTPTAAEVQATLDRIASHRDTALTRRLGEAKVALRLLDAGIAARLIRRSHERASPNIFRILGLETKEDTVSRIIAWLLDPQASHGLGASFLLDFLLMVAPRASVSDQAVIARWLHDSTIWSWSVQREMAQGNCRADVVLDGSAGRLVVETKLSALEGDGQTHRYAATFNRPIGTVYVYVCPDGAPPPASSRFSIVRYSALLALVAVIPKRYIVHEDTRSLLQQFITSVLDWSR